MTGRHRFEKEMKVKTTRQGNPSVDPELQMVLYPEGEIVLFFHRINGEPLPGPLTVRIKADGTLTPGQMKRLLSVFEAGAEP